MSDVPALDERNALIDLIEGRRQWLPGHHVVTDTGYDFTEDRGEFVYEVNGWRYEVTVKVL
jgi:hypothetical protein